MILHSVETNTMLLNKPIEGNDPLTNYTTIPNAVGKLNFLYINIY